MRDVLKLILEIVRDGLCYVLLPFFLLAVGKPSGRVKSVLHISLISHKQYMLSRVLRELGLKSDYFALNAEEESRLNIGYDYNLPDGMGRLKRLALEIYYLWAALARYDVLHFHFNTTISRGSGWELKFLRKMGKVLVFHFRGCDLRSKSANMKKNPGLNACMECDYPEGSCDTSRQRRLLDMARKYGDLFFVTTPDLRDFFEKAEHIPFIAPFGIDFDSIQPAPKTNNVFRVVTSSNHPGVDGVPHVRRAVDRLRGEGVAIELVEVVRQPFMEALAWYKSADLYAGKLMMGYYNNANIETMMMGIPNMAYIRGEYLKDIPDCPIIVVRPDNVYENIKEWIGKPDALGTLGARGRAFVQKRHNPSAIAQMMVDRYNGILATKEAQT